MSWALPLGGVESEKDMGEHATEWRRKKNIVKQWEVVLLFVCGAGGS